MSNYQQLVTNDNQRFVTSDNRDFYVLGGSDFNIHLYQSSAEPNRVDKSEFLTFVSTLTGALRDETSIISPSILVEVSSLPRFNYVHIPEFDRYYFVSDITSVRTGLWEISLDVDVLMSYKEAIYDTIAFVDRNEFKYDDSIIDKKRVIRQGYDFDSTIDQWIVNNKLFIPASEPTFVVSGVGLYLSLEEPS